MVIRGKAHRFGDDINTDDIIAARYLDSQDPGFLGSKCMESLDKGFSKRINRGDIIVAGKNFGCGSSREHAPLAIKGAGISLVIAESFARIFYRNSINTGLPILQCKEAKLIESGDEIKVDLTKGQITIINKNKTLYSERFPPFLQELIETGGLINWIKRSKKKKK